MKNNLFNKLFGPLDKSACDFFLIMSVIYFICFCAMLVLEIVMILRNYNKLNTITIFRGIILTFNALLIYFVNRLFYTMCHKSLI